MRFPADYIEPFSFMDFNVEPASDLKRIIGVRVCCSSAILDHDFSRLKLGLNKLGFCLFWQMKVLAESFERVESIMHTDGDGSGAFHGHVANTEQGQ